MYENQQSCCKARSMLLEITLSEQFSSSHDSHEDRSIVCHNVKVAAMQALWSWWLSGQRMMEQRRSRQLGNPGAIFPLKHSFYFVLRKALIALITSEEWLRKRCTEAWITAWSIAKLFFLSCALSLHVRPCFLLSLSPNNLTRRSIAAKKAIFRVFSLSWPFDAITSA